MEYIEELESMLFNLKEAIKDCDALELKKDIDNRIQAINEHMTIDEEENKAFIKKTASSVSESFKKRRLQVLTDAEIIKKIDNKIDYFRLEHEQKVEGLIGELMKDIERAVDDYSTEIVKRLDPFTIKERFKKKDDFQLWLTTVNDSYKNKMEKTVDRRLQSTIRNYLVDVEDVFITASRYLSDRESFMELEDSFYGSLASSKNLIIKETGNRVSNITIGNKTLYEASEDLFNHIWAARKNYDVKKSAATAIITGTAVTGAGTGFTAASLSTYAFVAKATEATLIASAAATLPIIAGVAACVITGIVISKFASRLSAAMYSGQLEKEVKNCIEDFKIEINKSKLLMQRRISDEVNLIFNNELKSLDTTFLEFRKMTYLDEDKLPVITSKLEQLEGAIY